MAVFRDGSWGVAVDCYIFVFPGGRLHPGTQTADGVDLGDDADAV